MVKNLCLQGQVLEIGCSIGFFSGMYLYPLYRKNLTSCDISEVAISKARKNYPLINFEVQSLPKTHYKDGKFSLVMAMEVLYYLSEYEQIKAIEEIHRILDDSGYLLVSVTTGNKPYFRPLEVENLMKKKFEILKTDALYIKSYYDHLEKRIFNSLNNLVRFNEYWRKDFNSFSKRTAKNNLFPSVKNEIVYHVCIQPVIAFFKFLLKFMPIKLIDSISRKVNPARELSAYIILARKRYMV